MKLQFYKEEYQYELADTALPSNGRKDYRNHHLSIDRKWWSLQELRIHFDMPSNLRLKQRFLEVDHRIEIGNLKQYTQFVLWNQ